MISFLFKVWGLARPYRGRLILGIVTSIIAGLLEPLMIVTVKIVFEMIFPSANSTVSHHSNWMPEALQNWLESARQSLVMGAKDHPQAVFFLVGAVPIVIFLRGLFSYLSVYLLQWVAIRSISDLRAQLFESLVRQPVAFFSGTSTGELMSRITNDCTSLHTILSSTTAIIIKDPVTLIGLLAGLLLTQPRLTLISMLVMPLCTIPIVIYGRKIRRASGTVQTHLAELTGVINESFTGIRIVKAYNLENAVTGQFRSTISKVASNYMRIIRSSEITGPLLETFGAIGVAFVLLYLALHRNTADASDFLFTVLSIFSMYKPIKSLTQVNNALNQARAASARVFDLLATKSNLPEPAQPKPLSAIGKDIQFDGIDFSYGDRAVLREINLTVKAGQLVALVGKSGSGKTTLTNLLLRFYDPKKGAVRIGGLDIREVSTNDLRSQIAVVTQETVLFNESIRQNIAMGRPGASNSEIEDAARHAHAHEFIIERPGNYDASVSEKGHALSGGQRQRLSIARAIVRNAPILILDEATNALDPEGERIVQAALEELMKGRTTICVAHRFSTVQRADVIVVMNEGRIAEMGRHEELLKLDGIYRRLYELQFAD